VAIDEFQIRELRSGAQYPAVECWPDQAPSV